MSSILSLVAAIEALGLLGAFATVAALYRRVRVLEARAAATDAQVVAVAREAQQMGAAVALRLTEQRQAIAAVAAKPRRSRGAPTRAEAVPPSIVAAPRGQEPVAVLPVKAAPAPAVDETALSDHDLARERGMDPLGLAIQRKLVGQAIRTA
ncbi:MAG: hypothetical protein ACRDIE_18875 [Chloroflexota bacterium]